MSATIITINQQFDWYFYANDNIVVVSGPKHFTALSQVGGGQTRSADFAGRKVKVYLTPR